jgi:hypothetical protein
MLNKLMLAALILPLFIVGCDDDEPIEDKKPVLDDLHFENGSEVEVNDSIQFHAKFSDDNGLSEAYFEAHNNFSGHKHGKVNTKFSDAVIVPMSGKSQSVEAQFVIPENAASGPYHLEVSALDDNGNRSDVSVYDFEITRPDQPQYKSLPTDLTVTKSSTFNITFEVTDETDIKEISYELFNHDTGEEIADGDIDLEGMDDKSFTFDQDFSASSTTGELEFIVRTFDSDENLSVAEIEIEVQ